MIVGRQSLIAFLAGRFVLCLGATVVTGIGEAALRSPATRSCT
jgi:hypothetical protein